ncbi:hypothetical protein ACIO3O_39230 [Streptomyces sp. NPDC087440]|uniref:hypothetical protein n=1 Tax=Streptomyces sp. NPDC087440 TaxID=3365790 RepID=UPI0037FC41B2
MRRTLLFGLTTALLGVVGASASYAAPALPLSAPTGASAERHCGGTTKFPGIEGAKANVNSCVRTNGQFMTVSAPADCFLPVIGGYTKQKICSTYGSWKMYRNGNEVATGEIDTPVPYVGPGTYKVISSVTAVGSGDHIGNSTQAGTTEKTFTLTTARVRMPFSVALTPGHLTPGQDTDLTVTVTRAQGSTIDRAQLQLFTGAARTKDPRCKRFNVYGGTYVTACDVRIGPGESTGFKFTVERSLQGCEPFEWRLKWGSTELRSTVPCPKSAS